jgi:hypothetical protein
VGVLLLLAALSTSTIPPEGVPLQVRRGFFTETDLGGFMTLGGEDHYSNASTYLQLGVGFDVTPKIELMASFGIGTSASNCFTSRDATGVCSTSDSFTMQFFDVTARYLVPLKGRLFLTPEAIAGYSRMDLAPRLSASGKGLRSGANVGGGMGVEYFTSMDHFSIGADLVFRYVLNARIPTVSLFPRVKYTF